MSKRWYLERWKARAGDVEPGRAFWLAGVEYARFGFDARVITHGWELMNAWEWETGELTYIDDEMTVFWFGERYYEPNDYWRLAAHITTRVSNTRQKYLPIPRSLRKVHGWISQQVVNGQPVSWRAWQRIALSAPRMNLRLT